MTIAFKNYTIYVSAASLGLWQSEIRDGQQRLVGSTCDRSLDSTLKRAKKFVEFLFEPQLSRIH
ncbi:MAG: hypothetical protein KME16_12005 [Scytolyngbya sp. HA4215-MV1]|jgi:hypothetical protein|nr:hypothetical protein [Scytolyngbya sp. HA4215-MV1]